MNTVQETADLLVPKIFRYLAGRLRADQIFSEPAIRAPASLVG